METISWARSRLSRGQRGNFTDLDQTGRTNEVKVVYDLMVTFWTDDAANAPQRHHFKVFKPVAALQPDDLPFSWMKRALVLPDGQGCDCC